MLDDPADFPDLTLSELEEEDHQVAEDLRTVAEEEVEDRKTSMTLIAGTILLTEMFEDGVITLREYIRLTNYIEERNMELEHKFL